MDKIFLVTLFQLILAVAATGLAAYLFGEGKYLFGGLQIGIAIVNFMSAADVV